MAGRGVRGVVRVGMLALALGFGATGAAAVETDRSSVRLRWLPASGPVFGYLLYVSRDGGPYAWEGFSFAEDPSFELRGSPGESVVVRVAAIGISGRSGPYSPPSDPIQFFADVTSRVANGDFESGSGSGAQIRYTNGFTIPSWEVIGHSVDRTRAHAAWSGAHALDLNGGRAGGVRQSLATVPGGRYVLRFALAGNPDGGADVKEVQVRVAGRTQRFAFDTRGRSRDTMGWVRREIAFDATSCSTPLELLSVTADDLTRPYGPVVDAVEVLAIEEPPSGCAGAPAPGATAPPAPPPPTHNPLCFITGC